MQAFNSIMEQMPIFKVTKKRNTLVCAEGVQTDAPSQSQANISILQLDKMRIIWLKPSSISYLRNSKPFIDAKRSMLCKHSKTPTRLPSILKSKSCKYSVCDSPIGLKGYFSKPLLHYHNRINLSNLSNQRGLKIKNKIVGDLSFCNNTPLSNKRSLRPLNACLHSKVHAIYTPQIVNSTSTESLLDQEPLNTPLKNHRHFSKHLEGSSSKSTDYTEIKRNAYQSHKLETFLAKMFPSKHKRTVCNILSLKEANIKANNK